jgi:DNA invertase Pin-like site-specific DNA recombinase
MKYGYARVSSHSQDHAAQVDALKLAGCEKIFSEKASGKSTDGRPQFKKMVKALLPGDTVVVSRLDRLARSSRDLHNILAELESLSVGFLSLREAWADTSTPAGRLMFAVMSGVAQFERELIQARCAEGIAKAKAKGVPFGRKRKLSPEERRVAAQRWSNGETLADLAIEYGCHESTMSRALSA